jgi:Tfp pilus assembly protein PilF
LLGGCATAPTITKLVNGRQIVTRSIDPLAYEHFCRALLYEDQDRLEDAAVEVERAITLDSESPELHAHLAELLLRMGKTRDAEAQVHSSLKIGVTAPGLLADAHVRSAKGDAAGMVAALRRARDEVSFDADDDDAEIVYLELADAELRSLDVPAARSTLEVLTSAEPDSGTAHLRLTAIYWAQGEMAKAEAQLRRALEQEPNQIDALAALAWIHVATGQNAKAHQSFQEALDRSENSPEIAAAYARFLVSIGEVDEAGQLADDLTVPDSSLDAETIGGRVDVERSARRFDRALGLLDRARALGIPDNEKSRLSLTRAAILKERGKTQDALDTLLAVPRSSPLFFDSRLRAAEILRDTGKLAEAARTVEQAAAETTDDRDSVELESAVSLALIDEKRGDPAAGIARLTKLLDRRPDEKRAVMIRAALEERRGNWQRALEMVAAYLATHLGSVEALNFWGFVAADHDHALALANKRLQVANALDPGSGGLIDSLGWVRFHSKDLTNAALFLEQAVRLEPTDPEIQWHLGEVCARRNETARAEALYRRALESLANKPDARLRQRIEASLAHLGARKQAK